MPRRPISDKDRCQSQYMSIRGMLRCTKRRGHTAMPFSILHTNETPGIEAHWTDEQEAAK